mmetsp:Transcript_28497/g.73012  ORF Transcript_28497/g.73012 Transcript_28497/m.73012 type:complete len:210 (+) Transcript_28497:25-654(+)
MLSVLSCTVLACKLPGAELQLVQKIGGPKAATYGELTDIGFRQVFDDILKESDSFVDLGSGTGKLVLQAAVEYGVEKSVGVELSETRHAKALKARSSMPAHVQMATSFLCADAAGDEAAATLATATSVWVSNLCFDEAMQHRLLACIEKSPSIQVVAALAAFPRSPCGFELWGECVLAQTTWTNAIPSELIASGALPGHPCVRYRRRSE